MITLLLETLLPLGLLTAFAVLFGGWLVLARKMDTDLERIAVRVGGVLAVIYVLWLIALGVAEGHVPVRTPGHLMLFLGGLIWTGHAYLQWRVPQRLLTLLPLGAVIVLLPVGIALAQVEFFHPTEAMESTRAAIHIVFSLAAVAFLLGSGVFSTGEVILHRQLRRRTFGRWFHHLPSLEQMNMLRRRTFTIGWIMITFSVAAGLASLWLQPGAREATLSHLHPMLLLWALISAVWVVDRTHWVGQQRMATASLAISALMVLLLAISVIAFFRGTIA